MRDSKLIRGLLSMFMLGTLAFGVAACGDGEDTGTETEVTETEMTETETEMTETETETEMESPAETASPTG